MILADFMTNDSKTEGTDVLEKSSYFVNKCNQIFLLEQ
jgi:hypothetical protein